MLGLWRGSAMYVGAILGPGVLVLPRLAAEAAGPASIAAWVALLALSVPVAATFAMLGARYPGGGGVSGFVAKAFGPGASAMTGWWFLAAIPPGVAAGAKTGAAYVGGSAWVAVALLVAAFAANHAGLRLSGGAQLAMAGVLAALLVVACAVAAPHMSAGNFTPFAPHGAGGVAAAVGVLFFAFVGWEAATHLSGDFADPRRSLPRVTALSLAVVAVIYIGLSIVVVGTLGSRAASEPAPLSALLRFGLSGATGPVTAVAALALSFGAINAYLAGAGRLADALARRGDLPRVLAQDGPPHRALAVLAALTAVFVALPVGVEELMRVTVAFLAAVTLAGCAAAVRLPTGRGRLLAAVASGLGSAVLLTCGWYLAAPAALTAGLLARWRPLAGAPARRRP